MGTKQLKAVCLCDSDMKEIWNKDILLSSLRAPRHSTQRAALGLCGGHDTVKSGRTIDLHHKRPKAAAGVSYLKSISSSRRAVKPKCHVAPRRGTCWWSLLTRESRAMMSCENILLWRYKVSAQGFSAEGRRFMWFCGLPLRARLSRTLWSGLWSSVWAHTQTNRWSMTQTEGLLWSGSTMNCRL